MVKKKPIRDAKKELRNNLDKVARIYEWAELMGYDRVKQFTRHFIKYFRKSPSQTLNRIRIVSIVKQLKLNRKKK